MFFFLIDKRTQLMVFFVKVFNYIKVQSNILHKPKTSRIKKINLNIKLVVYVRIITYHFNSMFLLLALIIILSFSMLKKLYLS